MFASQGWSSEETWCHWKGSQSWDFNNAMISCSKKLWPCRWPFLECLFIWYCRFFLRHDMSKTTKLWWWFLVLMLWIYFLTKYFLVMISVGRVIWLYIVYNIEILQHQVAYYGTNIFCIVPELRRTAFAWYCISHIFRRLNKLVLLICIMKVGINDQCHNKYILHKQISCATLAIKNPKTFSQLVSGFTFITPHFYILEVLDHKNKNCQVSQFQEKCMQQKKTNKNNKITFDILVC